MVSMPAARKTFAYIAAAVLLAMMAAELVAGNIPARRTLLAPAPSTSKVPAVAKPATTNKPAIAAIPTGFQKITCDPTPIAGKPYQLNPTGKVCGVWYDEIACQQVDGGSTFAGSPDVCCAPKAPKGLDDWPNFSNCIALKSASKTPVKCAKTGAWTQKVCCVKQVCKA